ncbi:choice-of-anchor B family protein [Thalassotalea fonticola]|uniref:Choice-of-anchor B family protein n=1 Tax=Thalassotalea fonticola TaxID=3065649 RepID=A0ABZ0GVQ1_9GAMM|nr:choice-of-anchor B family protein [Colwelliaceae bacterium S1-1]
MQFKLNLSIIFLVIITANYSDKALSHAEHDKARYVSPEGIDAGRCDNATTPCKTINYAAQHANKGDQIRLSKGSYHIENVDTLFYLLSDLIPIRGNYQTEDNFNHQQANNITYLTGVPTDYVQTLTDKGFTVIADKKAIDNSTANNKSIIKAKLAAFNRLQEKQVNTVCSNGYAGDHACNNLDLLAHIPLNMFATNPAEGNDIWGHYDLNDNKEYALIGLSNGIGIVDVSEPVAPVVITTIASEETIWRDIKVYQYFDISINKWQSYAYVTADNATTGLLILDLNQLPNTVTIKANDKTDLNAHNVYLSNVDYSTGVTITGMQPYLHIAGSNQNGGGYNSYSLADPTSLVSVYKPTNNRSQYTHDASSMVIDDERTNSQCVNGTNHCEVMFDFNEDNFQLWDKTQNSTPEKLSTTSYSNASYVHSGWYTEDKLLMLVHDELDEQNFNLNTTLRLFDITDLTAPSLLSIWTGDTQAIDHNGYVRGNRYYMSNYERGITVIDITDPTQPVESGFFDTYPISDNSSFHGAWGVYPFLPSGNILASDINSGLYILKDNTLDVEQGSLSFTNQNFSTSEGQSIQVNVRRHDQFQDNIEVNWELVTGSASSDDFTLAKGTLSWQDQESTDKTISIDITSDNLAEPNEILFIRLFDPKNGATLSQPNLATITIAATDGENTPHVNAGTNKEVQAGSNVTLNASASDLDQDTLSYQWQQIAGQPVTINNNQQLTATFTAPQINDTLTFSFTATDATGLSASDSVSITIVIEAIIVTPNPPLEPTSSSGGGSLFYGLFAIAAAISRRKAKICS